MAELPQSRRSESDTRRSHCWRCGHPAVSVIAERLRIVMARQQVTQAALGEHLGYTQTAVSYWCSGKRNPSLADLCALADYFDVTTDYLLGRSS